MKKLLLTIAMMVWGAVPVLPAERAALPDTELPDIWGREMTAPLGRIVNGFYLRDRGTGDYVITYTHHAADPETGNLQAGGDWTRVDFFAGNPTRIDESEADEIRRAFAMPRPRIQSRGGIWLYLPGEMQVKPMSRELKGVGCWVNYAGSLVLRDKAEKVVAERVVLRLLETPESANIGTCASGGLTPRTTWRASTACPSCCTR